MKIPLLFSMLLFGAVSVSPAADQLTFDQLIEAGRVRMQVRLIPGPEVVVGQKITLQIEVSTDRWFLGGTRIGDLEIKNVVVPRRSGFAVNSTRKEKAITWTVQQWDIQMYPRKEGSFTIPALKVDLTVSGDDNQPVKGILFTKPVTFAATVPDELKQTAVWFAANQVTLKESWDKSFDDLKAGDALTRTVTMEAGDIPAMILPGFVAESAEGMAVYPKSPDIQDKTARGESKAIRKDEVSYFFEQAGTYTLPEEKFIWWNLEKSQVETLTLKEQTFEVSAASSTAGQTPTNETADSGEPFPVKKALIIGLILVLLFWIVYRVKNSRLAGKLLTRFQTWRERPLSEKNYWKKCNTSAKNGKSEELLSSLYIWLDRGVEDPEINTLEKFAKNYGDTELENALRNLNHAVCLPGSTKQVDASLWMNSLSKARNKWRKNSTRKAQTIQLLNPQ